MPTIPSTEVINSWSDPSVGFVASTDTLETFRKKTNGLAVIVSGLQNVSAISIKSANYTLTPLDKIIVCDYIASFFIYVPSAVANAGREYVIKNKGVGIITVDAASTGLIEGQATTFMPQGSSIRIVSDGVTWNIL
jgi:hypothetical protein